MYLIYYVKNGIKGWLLGETKEQLQQWADENLDTSEMSGEDEYAIVDLVRRDLQEKLKEYKDKLNSIKQIVS